jgi:hypothetical protein
VVDKLQPGVFKQARLVVTDAAHGYSPVPGHPPQNTEVSLMLTQDVLLPFAQAQVERVVTLLRHMGMEL